MKSIFSQDGGHLTGNGRIRERQARIAALLPDQAAAALYYLSGYSPADLDTLLGWVEVDASGLAVAATEWEPYCAVCSAGSASSSPVVTITATIAARKRARSLTKRITPRSSAGVPLRFRLC